MWKVWGNYFAGTEQLKNTITDGGILIGYIPLTKPALSLSRKIKHELTILYIYTSPYFMKRLLFFSLSLMFFAGAYASDTTRVLFIGNSFTYANNMPQLLKTLADSAGIKVIIGMHAPGGISVGDTAQGTMAHMNNPVLFALIRSQKWDFAVIQDNQGRFVLDSAQFPSKSKVVQGHLNIMDSLKANHGCAKIILFGGWGWKYGLPPYGNTGIETIKRILVNYQVLNDTMKEVIAPIGEAWIKAINYLPAVNLWDPDDAHPALPGSFLTASVLFSTIFNLPAKNLNYDAGIASVNAYNLRCFADSAVFGLNFHSRYNLGGIQKISVQKSAGLLSVTGSYNTYAWYKNKAYVGNAATLTYSGIGEYVALLEETDGCLLKTCGVTEKLDTGIDSEEAFKALSVYPNPAQAGTTLNLRTQTAWLKIELYDMAGVKKNIQVEPSADGVLIFSPGLHAGTYLLVLRGKDELVRKKIVICD